VDAIVGTLIGVALGAFISQGTPWLRERLSQKKRAAYLAMRLAVILERFAIDCESLISENERSQIGDDKEGPRGDLPNLEEYPEETNWETLQSDLAHRSLALRNDIASSRDTMYFRWQMEDESKSDACNDEAAIRGAQAWELAISIRRQYNLPAYSPGYDVGGALKKRLLEMKKGAPKILALD